MLPCVLEQQGSGETEKTPPETEQAAGLPGSMIGFKIGETRQPTQVLNGCFASLQVFVAIGARMKRAFFKQAEACSVSGSKHGGERLGIAGTDEMAMTNRPSLKKVTRTRMQILLPGLCQGVGFRYGKK